MFDARGRRSGGAFLLAVVLRRASEERRVFRVAIPTDYQTIAAATRRLAIQPKLAADGKVSPVRPSPNARGMTAPTRYGVSNFSHLFTSRQSVALGTLATIVGDEGQFEQLPRSLRSLLVLAVGRCADQTSAHVSWIPNIEAIGHSFPRQALQMVWDFVESVPIAEESANYGAAIEWIAKVAEQEAAVVSTSGQVEQADARKSPLPTFGASVYFTDPPYYDSVPYSDLSDFFFVWLRKCLSRSGADTLKLGADGLSPKIEECVWNQSHVVDGKPKDGQFFEQSISKAFSEGLRILRPDGVGCVVFAHKTTEGWEALLNGLVSSGWVFHASWPIVTERGVRTNAQNTASLASSVHLVCRPRPADAGVGEWSEVKAAMEKRIREWLPTLLKHGVRGADAIFSCLGPALESYSRYEKVLTAADREVPLGGVPDATEPEQRGFLAYVFETLSKEALCQILGDAETEGFEEDSRMTALFLWTLQTTKANGNGGKKPDTADEADDEAGDDEDEGKPKKAKAGFSIPFDTFIRITRPMGIHYPTLEHRVIEIEKGIVRLLPVRERSEQLLGEAATRPGIEISLEDVKQMELGFAAQRKTAEELPVPKGRGKKWPAKSATGNPQSAIEAFTTLDRLHRAMLLFSLGRSALLRQVLETELRQSKRFERLALALNALYPESSEERRMLEGVQAAMRGVK